jgi:hypothetical protein
VLCAGTALADGIKAISADGEVLLGASTQSLKVCCLLGGAVCNRMAARFTL